MEIKQRHTIALISFLAVLLFNFSCTDDRSEELTSIDYERLFSPIKIEAFVINRTDARLSWVINKDVESYSLEVFADDSLIFAGTPVRTYEGVTGDQLPFYIRELDGETRYSVRIKSVASGKTESKWSGVTFKTGTENIFLPFQDGDVKATSVTLRWSPGKALTAIMLEPGGIQHTVTADEIAAGSATIEGLTAETSSTAILKNGTKTRGILEFMTLVDIGNAIAVHPEDDFISLLAAANDGDAFALFPGTYGSASKFSVNKSIEIKGVYPYNKPVLNGYISLEDGAALLLKDITLDGTGLADGNQSVVFNTAGVNYGDLRIDGCEIRNYVKGLYYLNVAAVVESITINNCLIYNIECSGGDFMDSRAGAIKTLTLSNTTVYNSVLARDLIRYDDKSSSFPGITSKIFVNHNTLYGVANGGKRLLYVRFKGTEISFTNNIVAETTAIFSNQSSTAIPVFGNNNYFNAPGLFTGGSTSSLIFDDSASSENPGFVNATNGDFTVTNELLKAKGTGDPRWIQ
ncbi:MAG: fibronectin type III domain-containing protein [Proteiniphilum sp.]